jgi:hypothetical protein
MKDLRSADEQTMRELAELFAPAREVYGKECLGLFEDEELYAQIRDRFERGSSCGEYPRLSEYLSNLSAKEKKEFFRTGGEPATSPGRALVPENPGLIVRRLQQLLERQFEFQARYPEAFEILFPDEARRTDRIGLLLPSFGIRTLFNEPRAHVVPQDQWREGDAYSYTQGELGYRGGRRVKRRLRAVHRGDLRGILLEILSRKEYVERIERFAWNEKLMDGVKAPEVSPIRITDLRLATALKPGVLKRGLKPALSSLQRALSAARVIQWKFQILGGRLEDPYASLKQMAKEMEEIPQEIREALFPDGLYDVLKQMAEQAARTVGEPFEVVLAQTELLERCFGGEAMGIKAISFAAAALLLFLDLDTPGVDDEAPQRLAERVETLADTVRKLARSLDRAAVQLDNLTANRAAGGQPKLLEVNYYALRDYRLGRDLKKIAKGLGINPYSSRTGAGSTDWETKVKQAIAKGKEVEDEHYPRAAAIFANKDNPHVRRKARCAYRMDLLERGRNHGLCSYQTLSSKIHTTSPPKERGLEITSACLQPGSCIMQGILPLP